MAGIALVLVLSTAIVARSKTRAFRFIAIALFCFTCLFYINGVAVILLHGVDWGVRPASIEIEPLGTMASVLFIQAWFTLTILLAIVARLVCGRRGARPSVSADRHQKWGTRRGGASPFQMLYTDA